jgi:methylase of polypeptide subunit release factors
VRTSSPDIAGEALIVAAAVGSKLWRTWLFWRFRLWQQRRHRSLVLEHTLGRPMMVLPEVFNPTLFFSSELLANVLADVVRPGYAVLDMGTGSGIQAITAACLGARVVAVDVLPAAVRCTRINALLNSVETQIDARQGTLFAPVTG